MTAAEQPMTNAPTRFAHIETVVHVYARQLERTLDTWEQRVEAITAGDFDDDDAVEILDWLGRIANAAEVAAFFSSGVNMTQLPPHSECWREKLVMAYHDRSKPARYAIAKAARLADALELLHQEATAICGKPIVVEEVAA